MRSKEAARRFRELADILEALDDNSPVTSLGYSSLPYYSDRRMLIGLGIPENKKNFAISERIERLINNPENSGPEQLRLPLGDDLLTEHLKRK